jgi:SAM-dependent methyltransferase
MDVTQSTDNQQATLWNGVAGNAWVELQEVLDQVFKPFEDLFVEAVSAQKAISRVLDVGCGTGAITLAIARLLRTKGRCTGIDISDPMIATARARAEREDMPASFIVADAQDHAFEPAGFDMIISRFGLTFFDDFVRAFANLRRAARDNADLRFIVWRSPSENPFMTTAERAAAPLLPNLPARRPDAPGQFAFADERRIYDILEESGWIDIDLRPIDVACTFPEKELIRYFTRLGPLGLILHEADEQSRIQVIETGVAGSSRPAQQNSAGLVNLLQPWLPQGGLPVRAAFDPYVHGADVRFTAACWMVAARAPSPN